MKDQRVSLSQVQETLLITLYAKALDYRASRSILHDSTASDIVQRVAVDFTKYRDLGDTSVLRARQLDDWTRDFVRDNQRGTVVSLGSGLDARAVRVGAPESVDWYDVDYPDVIDLRRRLLPSSANRHEIAASITGDGWLERIPHDRPTLIVAEGVLEYLDPVDVKALVGRLLDRFPRGRFIFDVMSRFAVESGKKGLADATGATHRWAVDDLANIDSLDERLAWESAMSVFQLPSTKELPITRRLLCALFAMIPRLCDMLRVVAYRFGD